ncbi:glutamate decarboxylase [Moniliophthora roreri]|uniref:Glutamate decarboxylase n=1 Tax=Moniliophthora roreri TaxID=221103 RepID=A0A0W0FU92_MONRR|nr:glutamate decarboxylase [Moniliophthora roreri]
MALSKHIDPDRLLQDSHDKKTKHHVLTKTDPNEIQHSYGARYGTNPIPKYHLPSKGIEADSAYQLIHDELALDGSPVLNLASFVHTWMPPQADKLMQENISKNLIDCDEYPATQILHTRCISMLAHLWNAPRAKNAIGTATTGSSEAIQLGGLAMKRIWQEKQKAAGKSIHEPGPNIVMGANAQVALEKFARYFDVECRLVPISVESKYRLDPKKAMQYVDENTIGVFVILGSTYTGHYEPVKEMADLLDEYEKNTGISVPIHVDAASGGFVAPFATPDLVWDFKIPRVVSINTSGHKFGLSYVGVGWVVWRDKAHLPKDLIFELHYLGSVEYSFSLNFSRPAAPIIAQYFNLIHLGFEGYRNVALNDLRNARLLSRALEGSGYYMVLSDIHRQAPGSAASLGAPTKGSGKTEAADNYEPGLPVVSFRFSDDFKQKYPDIQQKIVPNYELAPDLESIEILRVVVRENMSEVLIDRLVADLIEVTEQLMKSDSSIHALNNLGTTHSSRPEAVHGRMDEGSKPSGTYAKQC